jgi:hypothetical protein
MRLLDTALNIDNVEEKKGASRRETDCRSSLPLNECITKI